MKNVNDQNLFVFSGALRQRVLLYIFIKKVKIPYNLLSLLCLRPPQNWRNFGH